MINTQSSIVTICNTVNNETPMLSKEQKLCSECLTLGVQDELMLKPLHTRGLLGLHTVSGSSMTPV